MSIVVICKHCHGKGVVEKRLFKLFRLKVKCPNCKGSRKYSVSTKSKTF